MFSLVLQGRSKRGGLGGGTYSLSGLVIQGPGDVDRARHVFHRKGTAYVTARDLISNTRGCFFFHGLEEKERRKSD